MDDKPRSKSDPFLDSVKESRESGVRPGFLKYGNGQKEALQNLVSAEDNATRKEPGEKKEEPKKESSVSAVRKNEEEASGFYSGVGKKKGKVDKKKSRFSFRKKGPLLTILILVGGCGSFMMGVTSLMPMAIEEMIIEKFNSIGVSSTMASDAWLDVQLNQGVRMENLKTGETENMFAFSSYQVQQFENHGIKVVNGIGSENTSVTALLYEKGDEYIPVVGSDILGATSTETLVDAIRSASGLSNIGTPVTASEALKDQSFKVPYTTASKSWRGGNSGWYDNIMGDVTEAKLSLRRNRWARYIARGFKSANSEFAELSSSSSLEKTTDSGIDSKYDTRELDKDGNPIGDQNNEQVEKVEVEGENEEVPVTDDVLKKGDNTSAISKVLKSKAVKAAAAIGDIGCGFIEGAMSIYTLVSAYQSMGFLNYISGFLEAVDKVKAGDGANSPINEYANNLSKNGTTYDYAEEEGANDKPVSEKSGMEAAGIAWLFNSKNTVNKNDPSVKNVNFEHIMSNVSSLFNHTKTLAEIYETCGYVKVGASVVNLATSLVSYIPLIGQGVAIGKALINAGEKIVITAAVYTALNVVIPRITKVIANRLMKNLATEWFGEDLGNALVSGASKYLGGNGTSGGQSPGSKEKVLGYLGKRDTVIAEEAEYQRAIRSPFDVTSRYTFLGSIVHNLIPLAYSGNSIMSALSNLSSISSSAVSGLLPSANAIGETEELSSVGDCALLESMGAVGDAYCNPYIITDTSTIYYSPIEVSGIVHTINNGGSELATTDLYEKIGSDNFTDDGEIKEGSNLAKYITYCGQRTSQYGVKDATVAHDVVGDSTAKSLLKYIPTVGDLVDLADNTKTLNNIHWINGANCIADDNSDWETEYKYYARYAENMREVEDMNPGYVSDVSLYLRKHYEENPLDQSFEGTLARFSGMTKEEVEDTLALIDYYEFIANYNPSERYAFVEKDQNEGVELKFDNDNRLANVYFVLLNEISFADIRNRVATV